MCLRNGVKQLALNPVLSDAAGVVAKLSLIYCDDALYIIDVLLTYLLTYLLIVVRSV